MLTRNRRSRPARPLVPAGLVLASLLVACGTTDEGISGPYEDDPIVVIPEEGGAPTTRPVEDDPIPPDEEVDDPPDKPREIPTISGRRETPTVEIRAFPEEVMALKAGDLVEIELRKGGVARGTIRGLQPREIAVSSKNSSIITRHRPEDVLSVRLLYRPASSVDIVVDAPRTKRENWLDRFIHRTILGKPAAPLWKGAFRKNIPLIVVRACQLSAFTYAKHSGGRPYFLEAGQPKVLEPKDKIKLLGVAHGYQQLLSGKDRCMGDIYLYLVNRGESFEALYSRDMLQPPNLDKTSVRKFLAYERVTLAAKRPDDKYEKITRVSARVARIYRKYLQHVPDRPAMRRLRARRDPWLPGAEQQIRSVYYRMGLTQEKDFYDPLLFEVRVPSNEGGIHLRMFRKEIGLD